MKAKIAAARAICAAERAWPSIVARHGTRRQRAARAADALAALLTPDLKGLRLRHRRRGRLRRRPGAWRHGLHRGNRRRASIIAMPASRRSMRAPTAFRASIWSRASCRSKTARPSALFIAELKETVAEVKASNEPAFGAMADCLADGVADLEETTQLAAGQARGDARSRACRGDALWPPVRAGGGRRVPGARRAGGSARREWRGTTASRISRWPAISPRPRLPLTGGLKARHLQHA